MARSKISVIWDTFDAQQDSYEDGHRCPRSQKSRKPKHTNPTTDLRRRADRPEQFSWYFRLREDPNYP